MPAVRPIDPCSFTIEEKSTVIVFDVSRAVEYLRILRNQSRNEWVVGIVNERLGTDVVTPVRAKDSRIQGPVTISDVRKEIFRKSAASIGPAIVPAPAQLRRSPAHIAANCRDLQVCSVISGVA